MCSREPAAAVVTRSLRQGHSGTVGPDLDQSQPSVDLVVDRVTNGRGVMPPFRDQLSEEQIQAVAAYVNEATGAGG